MYNLKIINEAKTATTKLKNDEEYVISLQTEDGKIYSRIFKEFDVLEESKFLDNIPDILTITSIICLRQYGIDIPSFHFRKICMKKNTRNSEAKIILMGDNAHLKFKTLRNTF